MTVQVDCADQLPEALVRRHEVFRGAGACVLGQFFIVLDDTDLRFSCLCFSLSLFPSSSSSSSSCFFFAARQPAGINMCLSAGAHGTGHVIFDGMVSVLARASTALQSAALAFCELGSLQKLEALAFRCFLFL